MSNILKNWYIYFRFPRKILTDNGGEFSNIKNNPLWQTKTFKSAKARYIKLRALKNTKENNAVGYAEIDVITE